VGPKFGVLLQYVQIHAMKIINETTADTTAAIVRIEIELPLEGNSRLHETVIIPTVDP